MSLETFIDYLYGSAVGLVQMYKYDNNTYKSK